MKALIGLLIFASAACLTSLRAEDPSAITSKIGFDQNLGQQVTLDLPFSDENGKQVKLGGYFGARPVILMLGYYRCPMLCSAVADGLTRCLRTLPMEPGRDFEIVTVSIDPSETPEMALAKRDAYARAYGRPGAAHWHCLTGSQASIDTLAKQAGYRYVRDGASNQFFHASGIVILSPSGKISRYFFGIEYYPLDMRLALAESAQNRTGSIQEQILLFCYHYDPMTGRYGLAIVNLLRIGGVLTVAALAMFIGLSLRREKRRKIALPGRA